MKYEYQKLMDALRAPEAWNEQVLENACRQSAERAAKRRWPLTAACAACVLILAIGAFALYRPETPAIGLPHADSALQTELLRVTAKAAANKAVLLQDTQELDLQTLDGTVQKMAVTLEDGTERVDTYRITYEKTKLFRNEDGTEVPVPVLEGGEADGGGLYAVPEDAHWLSWPVEGTNTVSLSAPYGSREGTDFFHSGIDIPAETGTEITAACAGIVSETGFDTARGYYLIIDHGGDLTTLYGHCKEVLAAEGDAVTTETAVALVGATGMATGPHLHFEVRQEGKAQNPVAYFESSLRATLRAE